MEGMARFLLSKKRDIRTQHALQHTATHCNTHHNTHDLHALKRDIHALSRLYGAPSQGNVEDFLRRGDRGFAAPDASFQLRLDIDTQIASIRQISMGEGGGAGRNSHA